MSFHVQLSCILETLFSYLPLPLCRRALERRVVLCMFCKGLSLLQPLIFCTVVSCESVLTAVNCKQKFSDES